MKGSVGSDIVAINPERIIKKRVIVYKVSAGIYIPLNHGRLGLK